MLMRQMRQNTKIIMLVTALAFVALMVFEWGMDMSGQSAGGDLGRVDRTTVTVQAYQNTYRNLYDQIQRSQEQPISSEQNRQIEEMAWNEVVNQILIQNELARRGIRVTDEEIRQAARYSPPPEFFSDPAFQAEDGTFSLERYHQFLTQAGQDPRFLQQLEQYYRDMIPRQKLLRQVTSGVFISDMELWDRWRAEHEAVAVSVLAVDPSVIVPESEVDVSATEVEAYYRENRDAFAIPARADIRYTYLSKAPTPADTVASREVVTMIRQEILDGADFTEVGEREAMDVFSGVRTGVYEALEPGDLPSVLDAAVFSLPIGEVSDPIALGDGYHIIEVTARDGDQADARYIFVPIQRTDESEIQLLTRADSLESLGMNRPLEEAAGQFGLDVLEGQITQDFSILSGVGPAGEAQFWIFDEDSAGEPVSPLFENEDAFYMVEVLRRHPAGYLGLDEVRDEIESELRRTRLAERARDEARDWVSAIREGGQSLEDIAERLGVDLIRTDPFTRGEFVPALGQETSAVGVAFGTSVGEVSNPVLSLDRVVILRVEARHEASEEDWSAQRAIQRMQVTEEIQMERLDQWLDGLRETTRIVDNRAEYFRAVEDQQDGPEIPMFF